MAGLDAPVRIGMYNLSTTLGIGSFGKVKLGTHVKTGHRVAVKILNRAQIAEMNMKEKVQREIAYLSRFSHPHINRLYEVIYTQTDIFMVIEFLSGGELFDHIVSKGRLPESEARFLFQQIVAGVEHAHFHGVVHRDLKPENILVDDDGNIKLADFGLSNRTLDGSLLSTSCGSPNYAAPEVISGHLYAGAEVDVWSCGVILYALICGSLPFDDDKIPALFQKIKTGAYSEPNFMSDEARHLIRQMLEVDPLRRVTLPGVRSHPWFRRQLPLYLALSPSELQERRIRRRATRRVAARAAGLPFTRSMASLTTVSSANSLGLPATPTQSASSKASQLPAAGTALDAHHIHRSSASTISRGSAVHSTAASSSLAGASASAMSTLQHTAIASSASSASASARRGGGGVESHPLAALAGSHPSTASSVTFGGAPISVPASSVHDPYGDTSSVGSATASTMASVAPSAIRRSLSRSLLDGSATDDDDLDMDAVYTIARLGFHGVVSPDDVIEALQDPRGNDAAVAYDLICEERRRESLRVHMREARSSGTASLSAVPKPLFARAGDAEAIRHPPWPLHDPMAVSAVAARMAHAAALPAPPQPLPSAGSSRPSEVFPAGAVGTVSSTAVTASSSSSSSSSSASSSSSGAGGAGGGSSSGAADASPGAAPMTLLSSHLITPLGTTGLGPATSNPSPRRHWYVGIQSRKQPVRVMSEVMRSLRDSGFQWRHIAPYRIRARWLPARGTPAAAAMHAAADAARRAQADGRPPPPSLPHAEGLAACAEVRIGLQLFRVPPQRGIYLLDLRRAAGDQFSFMTLCARVIAELKVPASASAAAAHAIAGASASPTAATHHFGSATMTKPHV